MQHNRKTNNRLLSDVIEDVVRQSDGRRLLQIAVSRYTDQPRRSLSLSQSVAIHQCSVRALRSFLFIAERPHWSKVTPCRVAIGQLTRMKSDP